MRDGWGTRAVVPEQLLLIGEERTKLTLRWSWWISGGGGLRRGGGLLRWRRLWCRSRWVRRRCRCRFRGSGAARGARFVRGRWGVGWGSAGVLLGGRGIGRWASSIAGRCEGGH